MSLSPRQKQSFYQSLAQLLRSGVPFPSALDKLIPTASGALRKAIVGLRKALTEGLTVGDAFKVQPATFSAMEAHILFAVERGGRLENGCKQLGSYYEALSKARDLVIQKSGYPVFVLHFGVLTLSLPALFTTGTGSYLRETLPLLGAIYVGAIALYFLVNALRDAGATSPTVDRFLSFVPWIGKVRRAFSCARFCTIYQIELDAGVNVIDALLSAGRASRSGRINAAVQAAVPSVRSGLQVGPLLAQSRVFPETMARSLVVGEESGELDRELQEMSIEYQAEALRRLETATGAITKLLYVSVLVYMGYRIAFGYKATLDSELKMLDM